MPRNTHILSVITLAMGVSLAAMADPIVHQIDVFHPGMSEDASTQYSLFQFNDEWGYPDRFYLDVDSVICGDGRCAVIPVRLNWDMLGHFVSYSLPEGSNLTKKDDHGFTEADHEKLLSILMDKESPLKWVQKDQIVDPQKAIEGMDGVSGATALSSGDAVVQGAAYTSFTLWHWANGMVSTIIPGIAAGECNKDQLLHLIRGKDNARSILAIRELTSRSIYDSDVLQVIADKLRNGDKSLTQPILDYLLSTPAEDHYRTYYLTLEDCYPQTPPERRIKLLDSIGEIPIEPPQGYFDRISKWLPEAHSYYEVHLLLTLLENRNPGSSAVNEQACRLLADDNFLIARRAYGFLSEQVLNPVQQADVEAFKETFADRL